MNFSVKTLGILINNSKTTNVGAVNREKYIELAEEFGAQPFKTEIKNSCVVDECKEFSLALSEYKPHHDISYEFKHIVEEIRERIGE